MFQVGVEYGWL